MNPVLYWLMGGVPLLLADHLTKEKALKIPFINFSYTYPYAGVPVFQDWCGIDLSFNLAINRGAAWGILEENPKLLLAIRLLCIALMAIYTYKKLPRTLAWHLPVGLILFGAIGNLWDVIHFGYVIDMIHVTLWGYHYPIFNLADSSITIGVLWWMGMTLMTPTTSTKTY